MAQAVQVCCSGTESVIRRRIHLPYLAYNLSEVQQCLSGLVVHP